jgi:clan AA aspartic protease (TIGR02281 family)
MRRWLVALLVAAAFAPVGPGTATLDDPNEAGKAAYARGDYATAERLFTLAVERQPREPLFHYHRAVALTQLGRWPEALRAYEATLALKPSADITAAASAGMRALIPLLKRQQPSSIAEDTISVPLAGAGGVWFTEVTLNDTRTAWFMVDTGATLCVLSPELADSLSIRPTPDARMVNLKTGNGWTSGPLVSISSIRLGEAEARNVAAVILESAGLRERGILGNTFLSRYLFTLDSDKRVLNLRPR